MKQKDTVKGRAKNSLHEPSHPLTGMWSLVKANKSPKLHRNPLDINALQCREGCEGCFRTWFHYCHLDECVKAHCAIRQGEWRNSSRSFLKSPSSFPKSPVKFFLLFLMQKTAYCGLFQSINNKNHIIFLKNVTGFIFYSYFCGNYDIGIKGACPVPSLVLVEIDRKFR